MTYIATNQPLRLRWVVARAPLSCQAAHCSRLRPCRVFASAAEQPGVVSAPSAAAPAPSNSSSAAPPAPAPPAPSKADSLPPERLKQLRRDGLAMKDVIKLGRRGPAEGLASQVQRRWNTSEVARLYCHGKHAANMKILTQQLEAVTGGVVVHRAGGTVLIYRGDDWQQRAAQYKAAQQQQEGAAGQQQAGEQQQQQEPVEQQQATELA